MENVKFKKSVEYTVIGLSINQDINSKIVAVIDTDRQHFLSNLIQQHVKDIKELNLDLLTLKYPTQKHLR